MNKENKGFYPLTTLDEALENFHGEPKPKTKHVDSTFEQQVMLMLRAINDKVNSIDRYIRSRQSDLSGRTYVSNADRAESHAKQKKLNDRSLKAIQEILNKIAEE